MIVNRVSSVSGKSNSMELNITEKQLKDWKSGVLAQEAFPNLSDNEREFIMTGITPEEWDNVFGGDE